MEPTGTGFLTPVQRRRLLPNITEDPARYLQDTNVQMYAETKLCTSVQCAWGSFALLILRSYTIYLSLGLHILGCEQNSTNSYILVFHHNDLLSSIQNLLSSNRSFIMEVFFCIVLCAESFWVAMSFLHFWNTLSLLSTPDINLSFIPGTRYHPLSLWSYQTHQYLRRDIQ